MQPEKFVELLKRGLSLDLVYLLKLYEQKADLSDIVKNSTKFDLLCVTLVRKGLTTAEGEITLSGKELLEFIDSKDKIKLVRKKASEDLFEEWWKTYPGTNKFTHKGKSFEGTRAMRIKKDECKLKYYAILNEGEYTAAQLLEALKIEVLMKKDESIKVRDNKLTYMQNSLTYLNQRTFDPFVELIEGASGSVEATSQSFDV